MSGETTAARWAEETRPAVPNSARQTESRARWPVTPDEALVPQTNDVSNSSRVARTMIDAATDIAVSKSCGVGPHAQRVVDDERDVAAPRVEVLPDEQPGVVGDGHRLGRRPPVHVPQVVTGHVLAQRVEGQVALGHRVGRDALEVAQQARAQRVHRHHRRPDQDLDHVGPLDVAREHRQRVAAPRGGRARPGSRRAARCGW